MSNTVHTPAKKKKISNMMASPNRLCGPELYISHSMVKLTPSTQGESGPEGDKYPVSHICLVDEGQGTQFTLIKSSIQIHVLP